MLNYLFLLTSKWIIVLECGKKFNRESHEEVEMASMISFIRQQLENV